MPEDSNLLKIQIHPFIKLFRYAWIFFL